MIALQESANEIHGQNMLNTYHCFAIKVKRFVNFGPVQKWGQQKNTATRRMRGAPCTPRLFKVRDMSLTLNAPECPPSFGSCASDTQRSAVSLIFSESPISGLQHCSGRQLMILLRVGRALAERRFVQCWANLL